MFSLILLDMTYVDCNCSIEFTGDRQGISIGRSTSVLEHAMVTTQANKPMTVIGDDVVICMLGIHSFPVVTSALSKYVFVFRLQPHLLTFALAPSKTEL